MWKFFCVVIAILLVHNDRVEGQSSTKGPASSGSGGGGPAAGSGGPPAGSGGPAAGGGGTGTGSGGGGSGALPVATASGHWIVLLILSLVFIMVQ